MESIENNIEINPYESLSHSYEFADNNNNSNNQEQIQNIVEISIPNRDNYNSYFVNNPIRLNRMIEFGFDFDQPNQVGPLRIIENSDNGECEQDDLDSYPITSIYIGNPDKNILINQKICPICLLDFISNPEQITEEELGSICRLGCTHHFHSKCIDPWVKKNSSCPVCREPCKVWNKKKEKFEDTPKPNFNTIYQSRFNQQTNDFIQHSLRNILEYTDSIIYQLDENNNVGSVYRQTGELVGVVNHGDVELIQLQTYATFTEAIISLIRNDSDIIFAIMELTM